MRVWRMRERRRARVLRKSRCERERVSVGVRFGLSRGLHNGCLINCRGYHCGHWAGRRRFFSHDKGRETKECKCRADHGVIFGSMLRVNKKLVLANTSLEEYLYYLIFKMRW